MMQDDAADQLHIEMAHARHAAGRFPDDSKRLRKDIFQRLPFLQAQFEFLRFGLQVRRTQFLHFRFQGIDLSHDRTASFQFLFTGVTEDFLYQRFQQIDHSLLVAENTYRH